MREKHKELGKWGEEWAAGYLQRQGYTILERNVYSRFGEIDLVAQGVDGDQLTTIFVEVKTRSTQTYGYPEDAVDHRKREHLLTCASMYIQDHPELGDQWRVDVIALERHPDQQEPRVRHFKNVFS